MSYSKEDRLLLEAYTQILLEEVRTSAKSLGVTPALAILALARVIGTILGNAANVIAKNDTVTDPDKVDVIEHNTKAVMFAIRTTAMRTADLMTMEEVMAAFSDQTEGMDATASILKEKFGV